MTGSTEPTRERVLLAGVEGDEHTLGLQMVHDQLAAAGFQTIFDTDLSAERLLDDGRQPVPRPGRAGRHGRTAVEDRSSSRCATCARSHPDIPIVLGGPAVGGGLPRERGGMSVLERIDESVEAVEDLLASRRLGRARYRFPAHEHSRAIVTGGAGFIGSHVVDALLADGYAVTVIDDLSSGDAARVAAAARAARARHRRRRRAASRSSPRCSRSAIFHLAAQASVVASVEDPGRDCEVNVQGTLNVLEAAGRCRRAGRVHLDRRRAVRRRGADAHRRGADPRAAVALRRVEVGGGGVREHVVAVVGHPARRLPAGQRLRPAPEPARRGRRGGDLRPPPVHRHARRSCSATARRRATTSTSAMSSARCWRRRGARAPTTSPPASRPTWRASGASCSEAAGKQIEPELADLRPGELHAQLPGHRPRRARARLAGRRCRSPRGCALTYEALVEEFERS